MSLKGSHRYTVDSKRRVSLPSFSDLKRNEWLTITRGTEQCLLIYPEATWRAREAEFKRAMEISLAERFVLRELLQFSKEVFPDAAGRILLPRDLLDWAEIQRDVVFIGMLDHIELWDEKTLAEYKIKRTAK